jgi:hypothetical protein
VRVSFGVEVLEGVDDLYGEGAGQRGGQRMTTILENFIQINSQPERRTIYYDTNCCSKDRLGKKIVW